MLLQALTDSPDASALHSVADVNVCNRGKPVTSMMAGTDCSFLLCEPAFAQYVTKGSKKTQGINLLQTTTACWVVSYPALIVWSTACAPFRLAGCQTHTTLVDPVQVYLRECGASAAQQQGQCDGHARGLCA